MRLIILIAWSHEIIRLPLVCVITTESERKIKLKKTVVRKRGKEERKKMTKKYKKNSNKNKMNPVDSLYMEMTETNLYQYGKPKDHLRIKYR